MLHYKSLIDSLPGHISTLDTQHGAWQIMLIALEWQAPPPSLLLVDKQSMPVALERQDSPTPPPSDGRIQDT